MRFSCGCWRETTAEAVGLMRSRSVPDNLPTVSSDCTRVHCLAGSLDPRLVFKGHSARFWSYDVSRIAARIGHGITIAQRGRVFLLALLPVVAVACSGSAPVQGPGLASGLSITLSIGPTVGAVAPTASASGVSEPGHFAAVLVSSAQRRFGDCGGTLANGAAFTSGKLRFPNGRCWLGSRGPDGRFPVTVINTGVASEIYVNGSSATPADGGKPWTLCNAGRQPAVRCTGPNGLPGVDQYMIVVFGADGGRDASGLTYLPACDRAFGPGGRCYAPHGASGDEGLELIGPSASTDSSNHWSVAVSWQAVVF
jgi:hypothetical protein